MKKITEETAKTDLKAVIEPTDMSATAPTVDPIVEQCLEPEPDADKDLPLDGKDCQREEVRHVLLGSPEAIRQTMHQLHVLNYAESLLWSPVTAVGDDVTLTKDQGESMSLLRRPV